MNRSRNLAAGILGSTLLCAAISLFVNEPDSASQGQLAREEESAAANPRVEIAPIVADAAIPANDGAAISERSEVIGDPNADAIPPFGTLRFSVVDPQEPSLELNFHARLLAAERAAEFDGDTFCDDTIASDCYDGVVRVRGYEPRRLHDITIATDEVTDLGTLDLERGRASVAGRVDLAFSTAEPQAATPIVVELRGASRSPCVRCGERADANSGEPLPSSLASIRYRERVDRDSRCPHCGYAKDVSTFEVSPGGEFTFSHLASGRYRLRAWHPKLDVIGTEVEFELNRGEARYFPLTLSATANLELDFRIAETGAPYSGIDVEGEGNRIRTFSIRAVRTDGIQLDMSYTPPLELPSHAEAGTRVAFSQLVGRFTVGRERQLATTAGFTFTYPFDPVNRAALIGPSIETRARTAEDVLDPLDAPPRATVGSPTIEPRKPPHRCLIRNVPTGRYHLTVEVGDLIARDLEVFIPNFGEQYLLVPLRKRTLEEVPTLSGNAGSFTIHYTSSNNVEISSSGEIVIDFAGAANGGK